MILPSQWNLENLHHVEVVFILLLPKSLPEIRSQTGQRMKFQWTCQYWSTRPTHGHGQEWSLFSHMLSGCPFVLPSVRPSQIFKIKQNSLPVGLWAGRVNHWWLLSRIFYSCISDFLFWGKLNWRTGNAETLLTHQVPAEKVVISFTHGVCPSVQCQRCYPKNKRTRYAK